MLLLGVSNKVFNLRRWSCLRTLSASSPCPCGHLSDTCEEGSGAIATVESTHILDVLTSLSTRKKHSFV